MKEEGIIATSFTIYPKRGKWTGGFKSGESPRRRRERRSCRPLFRFNGVISAQWDLFLTGKSPARDRKTAATELQYINNEIYLRNDHI